MYSLSYPILGLFSSALKFSGEYLHYIFMEHCSASDPPYFTQVNLLHSQDCPHSLGYYHHSKYVQLSQALSLHRNTTYCCDIRNVFPH
jgi:hypothetical protein